MTRKFRQNFLGMIAEERRFIGFVIIGLFASLLAVGFGQAAMWLGFLFAAYAAVSNDSIQSLGTFIESNTNKKWWILWLFTGSIFLLTVSFSYFYFEGDVTYQRLLKPDGSTNYPHPETFSFYQIVAPLVLLVLTRMRMPVSTTFLLLSVFSFNTAGITQVVTKSVSGYGMAFILSFLVWYFGYKIIKRYFKSRSVSIWWTVVQWTVSGSLWAVWVMQDGANIAVFLPRRLEGWQFIIFAGTIFVGLGLLFYLRGDKIQQVVSEKVRIADVRAATLVDFTYVILLIYKLFISTVPMSTTWVFLGVMGGREIAVSLARNKKGKKHKGKAWKMVGKDFGYALIGLLVSVALAAGANATIRQGIVDFFRNLF